MENYESLSVQIDDGVALVTLCRPEILNRFDGRLHVEVTRCLEDLRAMPSVKAVVLASTGKVFSAGGDIELMLECHSSMESRLRIVDDGRRLLSTLVDLTKPLIVALHGDAIGLGASVALTGDAIVAARAAGLSDTHVLFALVAGDGGCALWPASAGMLVAKRHLLTGDRLPAEDAHRLGMVTDLVDTPEETLPAALALAQRIAKLPPLAVQGTKRALDRVMQTRTSEVVDLSFAHEVWTLGSDDLREAIEAFKEKRPASFQGR